MNENWLYGQYELDKNALLKYLQSNADSYMLYNDFDESQKQLFGNALRNISTGIKNGTLIGDGFGTFTDKSNTLTNDEITRLAFNFVHSVANALGAKTSKKKTPVKEIDEEPEKEVVVQKPDFDYTKNGLYQDFNRKYNPFGTDSSYGVWKQGFTDQESLNNNLLSHIAAHINNVGNGKYNWSNSGIDESSYIHGLNYLQNVIKTQGIEAAAPYLKYYGFNPNSFLYELPLTEAEAELGSEDAEVVVPVEKLQSQYNNMNALEYIKGVVNGNIPMDSSDGWRLAGLAADILSVIDPEPFSAAGLGYASDYANYHADEMDGINDSYWDDVLNVGLSTFGAIPILGDLGMSGKIYKNIGKYAGILSKLLLVPGIFYGVANADEIKQSVENVIGGDFTVEDLRNTWTLVQLSFGTANALRSGTGFKKAVEIDDSAQEALELLVKNNGKKQKLHFTGRHKQELEALQDNPEAFKKYLLDNFEGMDDIELANITKSSKLDIGWHKPKIVKSEKVNTETKLFSGEKPWLLSRAKSFRKSTTDPINTPTVKGKPATEPEPTVRSTDEPEPTVRSESETPTVETPGISKSTPEVKPTRITIEDDIAKTTTPADDSSSGAIKSEEPDNPFDLSALSETPSNPSLSVAPDLKSEALTSVNTTPDIKPKVGKYTYDDVEDILNKSTSNRTEKERLTKLLLSAIDNSSRRKARNVYNNKQEGSETYQALRVALGKAKVPDDIVRKMLVDLKIFKKGGILKAEGGNPAPIVAPDWYKNLYGNRTSLTGWTSDADSSDWVTNENTFHGNANSLDSVFKANQAYTQDKDAVGKDIQSYYKSGESLSDFVTRYNTDAGKIRGFWNINRSYGGDASLHNSLFRNMFASRSTTIGGNANYNLNYLENLLNKIGSSTWHRRMDRYEKDWEQLTDDEKRTRLHKIDLGNNNYGYVYKKANGDIAELDNSKAEKLLGGKGEGTVITVSGGKTEKTEKLPKQPKPIKPKEPFFTTDKLLELWKYYSTLRHNNRQLELSNLLEPLLYDPLEHEYAVRGDLPTRNAYYRKAADLMNFDPISTSDSNAYFAQMLEKKNKALQYELQGDLADNEAIRESEAAAREQAKENAENRYNIAMKNRENLSQNRKEKLLAQMTKERSDYESDSNFNATILNWIKQYNSAEQKRKNFVFSTKLNNWIQDNPSEYIRSWGPYYLSIWDKHNQGLTLTSEELRILQQIQTALSNAYQLEVLGELVASKQNINKPIWTPSIKKGGKVTKKLKDIIIKYLQESNKNYNKAIDRSVKGLYNSIKLERRK